MNYGGACASETRTKFASPPSLATGTQGGKREGAFSQETAAGGMLLSV